MQALLLSGGQWWKKASRIFPSKGCLVQIKLNCIFSFDYWQELAWMTGLAELPLSLLFTSSSTSTSTPKLLPVPVTLNVEWKSEQESIDELSGTKRKRLHSDLWGRLIHITAQVTISLDSLARTVNWYWWKYFILVLLQLLPACPEEVIASLKA